MGAVAQVIARVPASVSFNPVGEPIIIAEPNVPSGALSQAVLEAGLELLGEARLTPRLIQRVIDLTPLPCH